MANFEICCNPFKQRNHNPESWRLLPVTMSLREQFRLYLGDDADICLSCKRKLYRTLPNTNDEETLNNSIPDEIDETVNWSGDGKIEPRELNEYCDYITAEDRYSAYQVAEERQADLGTAHEEAEDVPEDDEDISDPEENFTYQLAEEAHEEPEDVPEYEDISDPEENLTYQLAKEQQSDLGTALEESEDVPEYEDISDPEENSDDDSHRSNSENTSQMVESVADYPNWYQSRRYRIKNSCTSNFLI